MLIHIAEVTHRHGTNIYTATSVRALYRELALYVMENLSEIDDPNAATILDWIDKKMWAEAVDVYFTIMGEREKEWVEILDSETPARNGRSPINTKKAWKRLKEENDNPR